MKRGDDDLDEIAPKRQRGDNKYNLYEFDDDDNNENNDDDDSEERNEDEADEGSDEPQIRFDSSRSVMR